MFVRKVKYTSVLMVHTSQLYCSLLVFIYATVAFSQEKYPFPCHLNSFAQNYSGISFAECKLPVLQLTLPSFVREEVHPLTTGFQINPMHHQLTGPKARTVSRCYLNGPITVFS
jgi:hypothetical protein